MLLRTIINVWKVQLLNQCIRYITHPLVHSPSNIPEIEVSPILYEFSRVTNIHVHGIDWLI